MTTLRVGPGQEFGTISAAVAASKDGDVVQVQAGTYKNDFATINTDITLEAVGGRVKMVATVAPPNGKAILVTNADVTIDGFEFSGAKVRDGNGAGIRYQDGHLTIEDSWFHGNENGLLAANRASGSITIRDSEFSSNGKGDGRTHNLYVGEVGRLEITGSSFHDASVGHEIKSRAFTTIIKDSVIAQGKDGTGSYSIDLPNGGKAVLEDNVIQQGAKSDNPVIVSFGVEGKLHPGSSLLMEGNTIINELASSSARLVWNKAGAPVTLEDNEVSGLQPSQYASGPATILKMEVLSGKPVLDLSHPWDDAAPAPGPRPPAETPPAVSQPAPPAPEPPQAGPKPPAASAGVVLSGGGGADTLQGRSGADILSGGGGNDVLLGNAGNDRLTGGPGSDAFVFDRGDGADVITDFQASGAGKDFLVLDRALFDSVPEVLAATTGSGPGGSAVIDLGGGESVTLLGIGKAQLGADDILFA